MNILRNDTIDSSMMPHQMDEDFEVARQLQLLEWEDLNNMSTKLAPPFPTTIIKQESVTPNKRRPANKQLHRDLSHLQQSLQDLLLDSSSDMKREPTMLVVKQPSCRLMNNSLNSLQSSTTTIPHFAEWTEDVNAVYEAYNDYDDNSMLTVPHPGPATGRENDDNGILGLMITVDTETCCSDLTGHKETGGATRPGAVAVTTTAMAIHTITPTKPSIHPRRARVLEEMAHQEEKLLNGRSKQPTKSTTRKPPLEKNDGNHGGHRATATAFCHVQPPSPILDAVCVPVMTPSSAMIISPSEEDDEDEDEIPMAGDNNNNVIWC